MKYIINKEKIYSIEYLRVWLTILVIVGHSLISNFFTGSLGSLIKPMGAHVNIFFVISGVFLFKSLINKPKTSFIECLTHRMKRLLPALLTYKVLCVLLLGQSASYLLSNLFMLNQNIGINIPTQTHIIWYVDVIFWVYLLYLAIFKLFEKSKALFAVSILSILSLVILFSNTNVNLHFQMASQFLDGGVLRGIAFMGMGILLSAIPQIKVNISKINRVFIDILELLSMIMAFLYPVFHMVDSGMVLNYILWVCIFLFLMTREYGDISKWLNKQSCIKYISKYCYEIYVFQLFAITLGQKWFSPHRAPILTTVGILIIAFVFGKLFKEYIEPLIFKWLHIKN